MGNIEFEEWLIWQEDEEFDVADPYLTASIPKEAIGPKTVKVLREYLVSHESDDDFNLILKSPEGKYYHVEGDIVRDIKMRKNVPISLEVLESGEY